MRDCLARRYDWTEEELRTKASAVKRAQLFLNELQQSKREFIDDDDVCGDVLDGEFDGDGAKKVKLADAAKAMLQRLLNKVCLGIHSARTLSVPHLASHLRSPPHTITGD